MGDLEQDTGTVAGILLTATRAPVIQVSQDSQCLLNNLTRFFALNIDDETDATRVVLELRIIKTLLRGCAGFGSANTL